MLVDILVEELHMFTNEQRIKVATMIAHGESLGSLFATDHNFGYLIEFVMNRDRLATCRWPGGENISPDEWAHWAGEVEAWCETTEDCWTHALASKRLNSRFDWCTERTRTAGLNYAILLNGGWCSGADGASAGDVCEGPSL